MNSESILIQNMESLELNLSSILSNHPSEFDYYHLDAERYDNQSNNLVKMMKNCEIDYGTYPNSHTVMKRNLSSTKGNQNLMTHQSNYNCNDQISVPFQRTLTNAYGYDDENWSHYSANNKVTRMDINFINLNGNLKKFIKSRIHSKKTKLQKPEFQMKYRLPIENYLSLKDPPVAIDLKRTGIIERKDLQETTDCQLINDAVIDWSYFISKLNTNLRVIESEIKFPGSDEEDDDFLTTISKPLEETIAYLVNKTLEGYGSAFKFLLFAVKYLSDHEIIREETDDDDFLENFKQALIQLGGLQSDVTSASVNCNLKGQFYNQGKMWMDALNKMIYAIKQLITYLWQLEVMIKSHDNYKVEK